MMVPAPRAAADTWPNSTVVVIEDEKDIRDLLRHHLEEQGFSVREVAHGGEALRTIREHQPALVILDLMLPGMPGLDICESLRSRPETLNLPVIILTAKAAEADRVRGLECGADDYVTKPFSPREFVARVKALLRRTEPAAATEKLIDVGALRIDPAVALRDE